MTYYVINKLRGPYLVLLDIGFINLANSHFIINQGAGFYKPTGLKYPPSHFQDYKWDSARLEFAKDFYPRSHQN